MTAVVNLNNTLRNLTIFTDTSFCPHTQAAGWGCWMRNENRSWVQGGNYAEEIETATMGEMYAIKYALQVAVEKNFITECNNVIFVTDNLRVQNLLNNHHLVAPREVLAMNDVRRILKQYDLRFKANKVKAHSGTSTPRNWVNDRVDKEAKKYMHMHRRRLKVLG